MFNLDLYRVGYRKRIWAIIPILFICCFVAIQDISFGDGGEIPLDVRHWFPLNSAWNMWQPFSNGIPATILGWLSFVMVALPASDLFYEDQKSRLVVPLRAVKRQRKIIFSHYFINFIAGFSVLFLLGMVQNLIIFTRIPMIPISEHYIPPASGQNIFPLFFLKSPFAYLIFALLRCGFFGGILACASLSVNYWLKGSYAGLFIPFFVIQVFDFLWNRLARLIQLPIDWFSQLSIRFPFSVGAFNTMAKIELCVWIFFIIVTYLHACRNRDVL